MLFLKSYMFIYSTLSLYTCIQRGLHFFAARLKTSLTTIVKKWLAYIGEETASFCVV